MKKRKENREKERSPPLSLPLCIYMRIHVYIYLYICIPSYLPRGVFLSLFLAKVRSPTGSMRPSLLYVIAVEGMGTGPRGHRVPTSVFPPRCAITHHVGIHGEKSCLSPSLSLSIFLFVALALSISFSRRSARESSESPAPSIHPLPYCVLSPPPPSFTPALLSPRLLFPEHSSIIC